MISFIEEKSYSTLPGEKELPSLSLFIDILVFCIFMPKSTNHA